MISPRGNPPLNAMLWRKFPLSEAATKLFPVNQGYSVFCYIPLFSPQTHLPGASLNRYQFPGSLYFFIKQIFIFRKGRKPCLVLKHIRFSRRHLGGYQKYVMFAPVDRPYFGRKNPNRKIGKNVGNYFVTVGAVRFLKKSMLRRPTIVYRKRWFRRRGKLQRAPFSFAKVCWSVLSRDHEPAQIFVIATNNSEESVDYLSLDDDFDSILNLLDNKTDLNIELDNAVELVSSQIYFSVLKLKI